MALQFLRLRRKLTSLSTFTQSLSSSIVPATSPPPVPQVFVSPSQSVESPILFSFLQLRLFTGSRVSLSSSTKQYKLWKEGDEITEDTVLFEGCDFNHWLITMDFPKDPKPTAEEMVATYERTCAQGLGISIEEAKKKIYACSTTTYQGFQAVMTEEESEKFKDLPGVVFVLPDSYIDPQNKEYGGDKYENGVITPRPPPVQYQRGRRYQDRNRNRDQPRYDQHGGPMPNRQGPGQNYPPQQNYGPRQNYTPYQNYGPQQNYPPHQNYGPSQNFPQQQNYGPPQNNPPQHNYGHPQHSPPQQNYYPPGQGHGMAGNTFAAEGSDAYQGNRGAPMPSDQGTYNHGQQGNYYPRDQRTSPQGDWRDNRSPGHRDFAGDNRNSLSTHAGPHGQGANAAYGQGYPVEGQRSSQTGQGNIQAEQGNFPPTEQTWSDQGR